MLQQAWQLQRKVCDSTFTIATSVQENCENIMKDMLELNPWMPAESKKVCMDYSEQYWLGLNQCKKASLSGIDFLEQLVTPWQQAAEKATENFGKAAAPASPKREKQA